MNFRKYKFTYQLFNLFKRKQLKYNIPYYKKYGLNKKYFSSISSEDFVNIDSPLNLYDSIDSNDEISKNPNFDSLKNSVKTSVLDWSKKGYVILENFFTEQEIDLCNKEIEKFLKEGKVKFKYNSKIMFAFRQSKILKSMGNDKRLLKILSMLMNKKVNLFQSINFIKGSQQRTHSDSIHMTTFPYGNLIAVWVALEDIDSTVGPLHYYPGSHKLPYVLNRDYDNVGSKFKLGNKTYADYEDQIEKIVGENNLKKKVFLAKKGDVLIWHANLLHGGEKVINTHGTRKSMVFHYYTNDAICFHEITQRPTLKMYTK